MREVNEEGKKNIKRYAGNDREKKRTGKSKNHHGNGSGEEKRKVG